MDPGQRYQILNQIAVGDFATVYRARDKELDREVAIKQIHPQFLSDPRQLERFWREAQLLASLQHPHIITIYDIVRERGWLVLELMRGNLLQLCKGKPIDVDYLRVVLLCCLDALRFLHSKGIIHGDVKPSNMLVDMQGRVKLGDFGLARRASNPEGSLLKGTTKYMAPEAITEQFGRVGPASDLYSLGFAAYELLCGDKFDSLFPALATFGPNKQIAWLMWHAAVDLKPPPVSSVLQGVPEDLAFVIDRLTEKDQSKRFKSAEEVIACLQQTEPMLHQPIQEGKQEDETQKAARRRKLAVVAAVCSLLLSLLLLFVPSGTKEPLPVTPQQYAGQVQRVNVGDRLLVLVDSKTDEPVELTIKPWDQILINERQSTLSELQVGDRVKVQQLTDASGKPVYRRRVPIYRITVIRPERREGQIQQIDAEQKVLQFLPAGAEQPLELLVSEDTKFILNGQQKIDDRPVQLTDLQSQDKAEIEYVLTDDGSLEALTVRAFRLVSVSGFVAEVNPQAKTLIVATGSDAAARTLGLAWAQDCEVILNGQRTLFGKLLKPEDLKPGDEVKVWHDEQIRRIEASRVFYVSGSIQQVDYDNHILVIGQPGGATRIAVDDQTKITLGEETVALDELRPGDIVDVAHKMPEANTPVALSVSATRPEDPHRWALVIAVEDYDDLTLTRIPYSLETAQAIADILVRRYRVPATQVLLLDDPSQVRFKQAVSAFLSRPAENDSLLVYYIGHAYRAEDGTTYLAPKTFNFAQMDSSGVPLKWLIDQLEKCRAGERLMLLDSCHAGKGADLAQEPSGEELVASLGMPNRPWPIRRTTIIASCRKGQRGAVDPKEGLSLFGRLIRDAYKGLADVNRDCWVDVNELVGFLEKQLPLASKAAGTEQQAKLFLPNTTPPRLTQQAKDAIRRLAAHMVSATPDLRAVKIDYAAALQLAGKEPEPKLVYGMLLMKARAWDEAAFVFEQLRTEYPQQLLPLHGIVNIMIERRQYGIAAARLLELVDQLSQLGEEDTMPKPVLQAAAEWVGIVREFLSQSDLPGQLPSKDLLAKLDERLRSLPASLQQACKQGRDRARTAIDQYEQQIKEADRFTAAQKRMEKRRLSSYTDFPYQQYTEAILEGMDRL